MRAEQATTEHESSRISASALALLRKLMESWKDKHGAQIYADLQGKHQADELNIAFCGHFSAGKSSMINKLCGSHVLPSGPVPTSANIVRIRSGSPRARIYPSAVGTAGETPLPWETTLADLHEYCRNGGDYSGIEVWTEVPLLGTHGVLMDTPGVDSTDDGHQLATHSALHLADVVFYVMDYNHVQSENNLAFAKNLSDWGKPLYLIINQIDKHREREISLEHYREQLENAFSEWGIHSAGLLFTSLKDMEHPLNQWKELLHLIEGLLSKRSELLQYSLSRSIYHAGETALAAFREEQSGERDACLQQAGGMDSESTAQELAQLLKKRQEIHDLASFSRAKLVRSLDLLLDNANLMPADVREAAGAYVTSTAPGFRNGLLSTAGKREKERQRRLDHWHSQLSREVSAHLEWHLIQFLREWGTSLDVWTEEAEAGLKPSFPLVSRESLAAAVTAGTGSSGEALLNFCRSLSADIKSGFRRAALGLADELLAKLPQRTAPQLAALEEREAALAAQARAYDALAALDRAEAARAAELAALLPPRYSLTPGILPQVRPLQAAAAGAAPPELPPRREAAAAPAARLGAAGTASPAGGRSRLSAAAKTLAAAAELLRGEPAMASAARSLAARAKDLASGRFTVALFGAFSAGKSSFANALLGEDVLPVSPHPATAAVNRILAPEGDFRHASAVVKLKSMDDIWEDITHSFQVLQLGVPARSSWISALSGLPQRGIHPSALPHAGFLKAAARGWEAALPQLGTIRTVGMEEYRRLVAEESRACFVQGIDLYYACPLTESGIILVDTPGADSLHARHTGVTFGYMKEADAICFVTYYNHAFSKADRSLLGQLGRIKDSFALDKMFFIINASDLASSEEELEEVTAHVVRNLRASGLNAPRIYALSSLLALEGKTGGDAQTFEMSRFQHLETELFRFAGEELPYLSLKAARESLAAVRHRAQEWQGLASQEAGRKESVLRDFQEKRGEAEQRLNQLTAEQRPQRDLVREAEELVYHVRQRIAFAFGRYFQDSFHPSLLREDQGGLKDIFIACGEELWRSVQRELEQELWATTLRLEASGRRWVHEATEAAVRELSLSSEGIDNLELEEERWPSPSRMECRLQPVEWSLFWSSFRSPRHFFEGPGREQMKLEVEPLLKEAVAAAAAAQEQVLRDHYGKWISAALTRASERIREELAEQEAAMQEAWRGGDAAEHWAEMVKKLGHFEQSFDNIVDNAWKM